MLGKTQTSSRQSLEFQTRMTGGWLGCCGMTGCNTLSPPIEVYFVTIWRSKNSRSLLVLRAIRRQRRAVYVILATSERLLHTLWKIPCSRNNRNISIKPPSTKWHKRRPRAIWSRGWVNLKKDPDHKTSSLSIEKFLATTPTFGTHTIEYIDQVCYRAGMPS